MHRFTRRYAALAILLGSVAACSDLEVVNPNDPTREQALSSATDIESLIAGGFNTWYVGLYSQNQSWLSNAAFQSSTTAANFGVIDMTPLPRVAVINDPAYADYSLVVERSWQRAYRALAAVADGVRSLDANPQFGAQLDDIGEGGEPRIRAFAKLIQGLGHATVAVLYDQGFVVDETVDVNEAQTPVPATEMMNAALGYFDEAIALAEGQDWEIPASWMSVAVSADEMVQLAHSWKAIFRASMPRTPDEPVDWAAVISDLDNGLTDTWVMNNDYFDGWYNGALDYITGPGSWGFVSYFVLGMADQSGNYQRWLSRPISERTAWFGAQQDDDPFLIVTPDLRFPQGTTLEEQMSSDNAGTHFVIPTSADWDYDRAENFTNPGRGTWRWSYYWYSQNFDYWNFVDFHLPHIEIEELRLLRAEALLEMGQAGAAADIINETRTAAGLNATDASGSNTSCVPRLPDESCGGLMEMLKWEKRVETYSTGLFAISWYFDGRRWGDLYAGTPLQLPVPAVDQVVLGMEGYTIGGPGAAPPDVSAGSSYAWPGEN